MSSRGGLAGWVEELEELIGQARGNGRIPRFDPADWQLAREWYRAGVPLEWVVRGLAGVAERYPPIEGGNNIQTLRFCAWSIRREISEQSAVDHWAMGRLKEERCKRST